MSTNRKTEYNDMPQLVNLDDSDSSSTLNNFINKIPNMEQFHDSFEIQQNAQILRQIVQDTIKNPQIQQEIKVYINDQGYDQIFNIQSCLGIDFIINEDVESLIFKLTKEVEDKFYNQLPQERESQNDIIIDIQINQIQKEKSNLQQKLIQLYIKKKEMHPQDQKLIYLDDLIQTIEKQIKNYQQIINLLEDHQSHRKISNMMKQYIHGLIESVLQIEITLTARTHKHLIELQLSQNEREKLLSNQLQRIRQQLQQKEQQLQEIQSQIQFTVDHYHNLEHQIQQAKQNIIRQHQIIRRQKDQDDSVMSATQIKEQAKSIYSEYDGIVKSPQKRRSSGGGYALKSKFKTMIQAKK